MTELVSYDLHDAVATITMDDGKVNALSPAMLAAIGAALDRAEADGAVAVLAGRPDRFSGGFDLGVIRAGGSDAVDMICGGFRLAERMLAFPLPVVVACTGHAIAMGSFLTLSGDYRVGASGPYRIQANEVAIAMTLPRSAIEICRQRLTPAAFNRALLLAEPFPPEAAVGAGWLDEIVEPAAVVPTAQERAAAFAALDLQAHTATKRRLREPRLDALRAAIEADEAEMLGG